MHHSDLECLAENWPSIISSNILSQLYRWYTSLKMSKVINALSFVKCLFLLICYSHLWMHLLFFLSHANMAEFSLSLDCFDLFLLHTFVSNKLICDFQCHWWKMWDLSTSSQALRIPLCLTFLRSARRFVPLTPLFILLIIHWGWLQAV